MLFGCKWRCLWYGMCSVFVVFCRANTSWGSMPKCSASQKQNSAAAHVFIPITQDVKETRGNTSFIQLSNIKGLSDIEYVFKNRIYCITIVHALLFYVLFLWHRMWALSKPVVVEVLWLRDKTTGRVDFGCFTLSSSIKRFLCNALRVHQMLTSLASSKYSEVYYIQY